MANALGVLQALIKQKHQEQDAQAFESRVIRATTNAKFDKIKTHHDYNRLSGVDKTLFLEYLSNMAQHKPRMLYSKKLFQGVGINDAPYQITVALQGVRVKCPAYRTWEAMLERCYGTRVKQKHITYHGCYVVPEWHSFMHFRTWWLQHYKDGFQLDKDLLIAGNKVYSADTCILIPQWLNLFTIASDATRGLLPLGVTYMKGRSKPYQAKCRAGTAGHKHLGYYATPEEAHQAWLSCKLSIVDARSAELEAIRVGLTDKVKAKVLSLV